MPRPIFSRDLVSNLRRWLNLEFPQPLNELESPKVVGTVDVLQRGVSVGEWNKAQLQHPASTAATSYVMLGVDPLTNIASPRSPAAAEQLIIVTDLSLEFSSIASSGIINLLLDRFADAQPITLKRFEFIGGSTGGMGLFPSHGWVRTNATITNQAALRDALGYLLPPGWGLNLSFPATGVGEVYTARFAWLELPAGLWPW